MPDENDQPTFGGNPFPGSYPAYPCVEPQVEPCDTDAVPEPGDPTAANPAPESEDDRNHAEAKHFLSIAAARIEAIPAGIEHGLGDVLAAIRKAI